MTCNSKRKQVMLTLLEKRQIIDSSHSLNPNVNNQEHSDEAISWDDAEKSMETVIKFLEKSPYFSDNYVLQAMPLRRDIIIKKLQNQEIVDFRDRLRNTMAAPESSIDENRNCNETHSMNKFKKNCILHKCMISVDDNLGNKYLTTVPSSDAAKCDKPALWYNDEGLGDGNLAQISTHESKFWKDFIHKYLLPLQTKRDDQAQIKAGLEKLRNRLAIIYILSNTCFIALILSLEYSSVSNNKLSFEMPCNVNGVHVARIRPLSIVFVVVFGILLVCQLVAMFIHRVSTFLHIVASIDLSFSMSLSRRAQLGNLQLMKDMQSLDKDIVNPDSFLTTSPCDEETFVIGDSDKNNDEISRRGRTRTCNDVVARIRQPAWASRLDNQSRQQDSLRSHFHENFENITARRYNKSESERLLRERHMAGFHTISLPALAVIARNSEFIRQRWERATRKVIKKCRLDRKKGISPQSKFVGIVNRVMTLNCSSTPALPGVQQREKASESLETPCVANHKVGQRTTRFVFQDDQTPETSICTK